MSIFQQFATILQTMQFDYDEILLFGSVSLLLSQIVSKNSLTESADWFAQRPGLLKETISDATEPDTNAVFQIMNSLSNILL